MKRPYIKLYVNDFFSSPKVRQMNVIQKGILLLLLMEASQTKCICLPDDEKQLAKLIGMPVDEFKEHYAIVKECFAVKRGKLHNDKLKLVLKDYDDVVKANSLKGKLSAESRRKKKLTTVEQQLNQEEEKVKKEEEIKLKEKGEREKELQKEVEKEEERKLNATAFNFSHPRVFKNSFSIKAALTPSSNAAESAAMLNGLEYKREIIPLLCRLLTCNGDEAINLRALFIEQQKIAGKVYRDEADVADHCISWCHKNGKQYLEASRKETGW